MALVHGLHFGNLRGDIYGGLTAAVVALPLALAFGVASGAGPVAGLYGAIFVGLFAALFGGTPAQVSGPTGPMTVVMAGVITQFADQPAHAFTVVMLAGLLQILFGAVRLGRYVAMVPFPVISGFMTGIGCIIIILQLGPLLGHMGGGEGVAAALRAVPQALAAPQPDAAVVGLVALGICFFLPPRIGRILPAPLLALFAGTALVATVLGGAPVLGEIPSGLPDPHMPSFDLNALPDMVFAALVLALLGSLDSLLTSLVHDNITQTHHESDRELIGQGIGNTIAGLFGAIPGAGATMRTVINVRTGGRTPLSGVLHALLLLAIALGLGGLAGHIPHAVLAGILIKVGFDIVDWNYLKRLHRAPRDEAAFMLMVAGLTVFVDLIVAVGLGVVMASLMLIKRLADVGLANLRETTGPDQHDKLDPVEAEALARGNGRIVLFELSGAMSFAAARGLVRRLGMVVDYSVVVLDLTDVPLIDGTMAMAIDDIARQLRGSSRHFFVAGANAAVQRTLQAMGVDERLERSQFAATRRAALEAAARLVADETAADRPLAPA